MRELQAQAAEKRMRENESKGIKDIESVRRQQAKKEQMDKMQNNQTNQEGNLKVNRCFLSLKIGSMTGQRPIMA